ncbi:MAG: hypothetical protein HOP13_16105 [Alphaproteobacteria bacterium]|nr:hypothetical protein [Alphaproteobacteria bacterium]
MFERLSSGIGAFALTLLLTLLPSFGVELPLWIRLAMAVALVAMIAWAVRPHHFFGKAFGMSPAETLMIVCAIGFFGAFGWHLLTRDSASSGQGAASAPTSPALPPAPPAFNPIEAEASEAQATVRGLWKTWLDRDNLTTEEISGLILPPDDWMNERLERMQRPYRVRANGAQFTILWLTKDHGEVSKAPAEQQ